MSALHRGDLAPQIVAPPPGPRARALSRGLARWEAPGINTLPDGVAAALLWAEARGANVLDVDGNRYLDLTAGFGVAAIGHRHPRVVAAVRRQAGRLLHGLGDVHAHPLRIELARRLARRTPVDEPQVYFAISGSDAVEVAVKSALLATGRPGVVAFEPAYHGLTLGALNLTSRAAFRDPFADHLHDHLVRLSYGCSSGELGAALAGGRVGAVILEPLVGREGMIVPPPGWLATVAATCRRRRVALIADEIFTGFGRTGRWFAVESERVQPDLLCVGKALGGGLPLAAVVGRRALLAAWRSPGEARHTATHVANPVACAAALEVLSVLAQERLVARAARLGRRLGARLAGWPERFGAVAATRGRGLMWGALMGTAEDARRLAAAALARGVLVLAGGSDGRVVQITPPLVITGRQLALALDLLEESLAAAPLQGR